MSIAEKLQTVAENVQKVYDAGYEKGKAEGGGSDDFIGVKYSDFSGLTYNLPRTADARSFDLILEEPSVLDENGLGYKKETENGRCLYHLFANANINPNGGYFAQLENAYLPSKATVLLNTFTHCSKLKKIYGDLTNIESLTSAFQNCKSLVEIPYMPNLKIININSFANCTGLTSLTFYKVLTTWHTGALTGCVNIETINLADGWNINTYVQHCPKLTQACLHDMIEKYADMTGKSSPVLNVGSTNLAKIDEEHKAMATTKNVTLA